MALPSELVPPEYLARPVGSESDLTPEHQELLARVRKDFENAEKVHKKYRDRWNTWYGYHRNYRRLRDEFRAAGSDDERTELLHEEQRITGRELFIPYAYAVVETKVPRLLMNNPRMKVKPRTLALSREKAEAIRAMFEERQEDIQYALRLIPTVRRGVKYGLGVSKNYWKREVESFVTLERQSLRARVTGKLFPQRVYHVDEGPYNEDIEILDFLWDPLAIDLDRCRWVIHRTWRDFDYVRQMVESGRWFPLDLEAIQRMGPQTDRNTIYRDRLAQAGLDDASVDLGPIHEVWEWHDGQQVVTVLDGSLVVQAAPSPFEHGKLPFSIFRPIVQEGEFVGMGELEPIIDLQLELNALRSMRLENAALVMQKAFIYAEGYVDPSDLVIGPGAGIPVQAGDIDSVIRPLNFGDLPAASYQETNEIKADIELASAISETVAGAQGTGNASETATGIQLVQAAADVRIELATKMLSHETVSRDTRQWLALYRQHTLKEPIRIPVRKGEWYEEIEITAQDLDLVKAVDPDKESLAPVNRAQERNDALALFNQLRGNELVDQRRPVRHLLDKFDVPDAESWLVPEQVQINPQVAQVVGEAAADVLERMGIDREEAEKAAELTVAETMARVGVAQPSNAVAPPPEEA